MDLSSINLKDKDVYVPWFQNNYWKIKSDVKYKELFLTYYNHLTADERRTDLCIENFKLYKKIEENKISSSKLNEKLKKTIAEQFLCVKNGIISSGEMCKSKYRAQVKSIKNAFAATLSTVNQKTVDLNSSEIKTSMGYFETELSLVLNDKWIIDYVNEYKKSMLQSLNQVLQKYLEKSVVEEIKVFVNEKLSESTINKGKSISSTSTDNIFKTPDILPPKFKRNSNNISNTINISGNLDGSFIQNTKCDINKSNKNLKNQDKNSEKLIIENSNAKLSPDYSDLKSTIPLTERTPYNNHSSNDKTLENAEIPFEKGNENVVEDNIIETNRNLREECEDMVIKQNDVSLDINNECIEIPENNTSKQITTEVVNDDVPNNNNNNDIDNNSDQLRSEKKASKKSDLSNILEVTEPSNNNESLCKSTESQPGGKSELLSVTQKKTQEKVEKSENLRDSIKIDTVAENEKEIQIDNFEEEPKLSYLDDSLAVYNFQNFLPGAESTKINKNKVDSQSVNSSNFKNSSKSFDNLKIVPENNRKLHESDKNDKRDIDRFDDMITLSNLKNHPPAAESTKINKPGSERNATNLKETKPLDDIITLKDLGNHPPFAESTKIDKHNLVDKFKKLKLKSFDDTLTLKGLGSQPPAAESTKIDRNKLKDQFNKLKLEDFNDSMTLKGLGNPPAAESTKIVKQNEKGKIDKIKSLEKITDFVNQPVGNFDNTMTLKGLGNHPPAAESTKIDKNINKEYLHEINDDNYFNDNLTVTNFNKFGPVAESTKKPNQFGDKNRITQIPKLSCYNKKANKTTDNEKTINLTDSLLGKPTNIDDKENLLLLNNSQKSKSLYRLNSSLENLNKIYMTENTIEKNFDKTIFKITKEDINLKYDFPIILYNPWCEERRKVFWKKMLSDLKNSKDVYVSTNEILLQSKINFKLNNQFQEFSTISENKLNSGNTAQIYIIKDTGNNKLSAVKIRNSIECIEYYVTKHVRKLYLKSTPKIDVSSSICNMSGLVITDAKSLILMSLYRKGNLLNLSNLMRKENFKIKEIELITAYVTIELLSVMFNLHSFVKLLHCDVKPDNILLNEDFPYFNNDFSLKKTKVITFIDFSKSVFIEKFPSQSRFITNTHPTGLKCIEMVANRPWLYQIDLFNVAVIIYHLLQNNYPTIVQNKSRYIFKSFSAIRELQAGSVWINLFDVLINIEPLNYPDLQVFIYGFIDFIKMNSAEYNAAVYKINEFLNCTNI